MDRHGNGKAIDMIEIMQIRYKTDYELAFSPGSSYHGTMLSVSGCCVVRKFSPDAIALYIACVHQLMPGRVREAADDSPSR